MFTCTPDFSTTASEIAMGQQLILCVSSADSPALVTYAIKVEMVVDGVRDCWCNRCFRCLLVPANLIHHDKLLQQAGNSTLGAVSGDAEVTIGISTVIRTALKLHNSSC